MLTRPRRLAVTILAAACLLTGCQPATTPTPTPAPSWTCTPEAGGEQFSCSQHQYDDMVAKDKLYAEAEAVYRKFFAENSRIYRAGGIDEPTATLLETTTGQYLRDSMTLYRSLRNTQTKVVGGDIKLVSLLRLPGVSSGGSLVALRACIDTTSAEIRAPGEKPEAGYIGIEQLFFARVEQQMKIQSSMWQEVEAC
ncbi:MAG: hypothetical protein LCH96_17415 [Actinobacteria bacterium]|nr:hypothetical protein [Actinomycetota bacterium]